MCFFYDDYVPVWSLSCTLSFPYLQELAGELGEHLGKHALSVEKVLTVIYQPQVTS